MLAFVRKSGRFGV